MNSRKRAPTFPRRVRVLLERHSYQRSSKSISSLKLDEANSSPYQSPRFRRDDKLYEIGDIRPVGSRVEHGRAAVLLGDKYPGSLH